MVFSISCSHVASSPSPYSGFSLFLEHPVHTSNLTLTILQFTRLYVCPSTWVNITGGSYFLTYCWSPVDLDSVCSIKDYWMNKVEANSKIKNVSFWEVVIKSKWRVWNGPRKLIMRLISPRLLCSEVWRSKVFWHTAFQQQQDINNGMSSSPTEFSLKSYICSPYPSKKKIKKYNKQKGRKITCNPMMQWWPLLIFPSISH